MAPESPAPDGHREGCARIREKLARLRKLNPAQRCELGRRLTEADLTAIERRLHITLPADYRAFLMQVGHGGAGPCYGLFTLEDDDEENITSVGQLRKPFRWTAATNPIDWPNPCDQEDVWCSDDDDPENPLPILEVPGALYICNYGCAIRLFLVCNGQSYGEVWIDRQSENRGLQPVCDAQGRKLTFLEWSERWLDDAILEVTEPRQAAWKRWREA